MSERGQDIKDSILRAFGDAEIPEDGRIVDNPNHCPECQDVASAFRGKHWKEVTTSLVRAQKEALPLLCPEAFRFFLPAYLFACIDARSEIDVAWDSVIFNLSPPKKKTGKNRERFVEKMSGFSKEQVDAIRSFLEFIDEEDRAYWASQGRTPPREEFGPAIEYWKQKCASS